MPKEVFGDMLHFLRRMHRAHDAGARSDRELLQRFASDRDEDAFAILVERHGPMVMGVCQRVLGDFHSAEDSFQATFIVLARRAASLRVKGALGTWLYAVAQRVALRAKAQATQRRSRERGSGIMPRSEPLDEPTWRELRSVLDEEIGRLPEKYRAPLVLHYFEGKSQDRAAKELGWPKTSLERRLSRGRELLRQQLIRRGITLSAGILATALGGKAGGAPVAALLTVKTVKAAVLVATGKSGAAAYISAAALALAEEAIMGMPGIKGMLVLMVLTFGVAIGGAGLTGFGKLALSQPSKAEDTPARIAQATPARVRETDPEKLFHAMERKILAARSFKLTFQVEAADSWGTHKVNGSMHLTDNNKARFEGEGAMGGRALKILFVSNGKQRVMQQSGFPELLPDATPARFRQDTATLLARLGAFMAIASSDPATRITVGDIDKAFPMSDFAWSGTEQVGKREAQVIEYTVTFLEREKAKVKLWIDAASVLPLKRQLIMVSKNEPLKEMYTEFVLDPQLDATLFELPQPKAGTPAGQSKDDNKKEVPDLYGDPLPPGAVARLGTVRFRPGTTSSVTFVPASDLLATPSALMTTDLRLWDAATGRLVRRLGMRGGAAPAFSADGKLLFTSQLGLFEVASGRQLRQLHTSSPQLTNVAFARDGRLVATGEGFRGKHRVYVWDVATGKEVYCLLGHTGNIASVAFSGDSKLLASASEDKTIRLWDLATGKEVRRLDEHQAYIRVVVFAPRGALLASAGEDGIAVLWDSATGKLLHRLRADVESRRINPALATNEHLSLAFAPDGKVLATGGHSGIMRLWNTDTAKEIRQWTAHGDRIESISFASNGKTLASVGFEDNAIRVWDTASGKQLNSLAGHTGKINSLQFAADGRTLWSTAKDKKMLEWDVASSKERRLLFETLADSSRFSPDGTLLASSDNGGGRDLRLREVATGKELHHLHGIQGYAFSHDGKSMYLASTDNRMRQLEIVTGKELGQWNTPGDASGLVEISRDGKFAASTNYGEVLVWAMETGKEILRFNNFRDRSRPLRLAPRSLAFSPTGRVVAIGGMGSGAAVVKDDDLGTTGAIQLWDVYAGQKISQIDGPQGMVWALAFAPDGRTLASGGNDSTILLWDLTGKAKMAELKSAALTAADIEGLWFDLGADAAKADRAIWALARAGKQGVPLLSERMRPAAPADSEHIARLVVELDSGTFQVRQKAVKALEKIGEPAEAALRKVMTAHPTLEVRQRVEQILDKRNNDPEIVRRLRAIEALEQIGNPDARRVLETLAKTAPNPRVAQAAGAALRRLTKQMP